MTETKNFYGWSWIGMRYLTGGYFGNLKKALQRGYATTTTNSGHWGPSIRDFSWAYNDSQAEVDFAYRAVHESIRAARELIRVFYDQEAIHSYFWSCSNGGRQAAMEAAGYPKDFDGIISKGPQLYYKEVIMLVVWLRQTNTGQDGKDIIKPEDLSKISKGVYDACDKSDREIDRLVSDPSNCPINPEVLICDYKTNCLSKEKVEVLKEW